jgi:Na+/H+ antiporter NhaC
MEKKNGIYYFRIIAIFLFILFCIAFYVQTITDYSKGYQRIVGQSGPDYSPTYFYHDKNPGLFYEILTLNILIPLIILFLVIKGINYFCKNFEKKLIKTK